MSKNDAAINLGGYVIDDENSFPFAAGAFGKIYYCRKANSRKNNYAAKSIPNTSDDIIQAEKDIAIALKNIKSEYVLQYKAVIPTKEFTYFITKFCNATNLQKYIDNKIFIPMWEVQRFTRNMIDALKDLHANKIIHRDIKPENFFLHHSQKTNMTIAILADYGFSIKMKTGKDFATTILGTPVTMAPEVKNMKGYDSGSDIWSIGTSLYDMAFGHYPFEGNDFDKKIIAGDYEIPANCTTSIQFITLLENCLQNDFTKRPSALEIMNNYDFLKENISKLDFVLVKTSIKMSSKKTNFKEQLKKYEEQLDQELKDGKQKFREIFDFEPLWGPFCLKIKQRRKLK